MLTTYEAVIQFRYLPKNELALCVKRVAGLIFDKEGILRNLLYMGGGKTPRRISKNKTPFWEAHYLYYEFNAPKIKIPVLGDELERDTDVIRHTIIPIQIDFDLRTKPTTPNPQIDYDACTFEEENVPVPYRPEVIKLVELAKRITINKTKKRVKLNTNCEYYPFQR